MIRTSILSALILTSALFATHSEAGLIDRFTKKTKIPSYAVQDIYAGLKFNYLDKKDRLLILKDFLTTTELQYALLPLKKELIGLDYEKMKAEAIKNEEAIEDVVLSVKDRKNNDERDRVTFLQANSNMDFLDRMALIVAKFKDTHFIVNPQIPRPFIYTGVRLFRMDGKIVVGSLEKKFLEMVNKLSGADLSGIKIGDEVISIDGIPVEEKIKELKPYVSGSSEEFIDNRAVLATMFRNFKYEKKNHIKVVFKNAGAMKLPVFANSSAIGIPRLDVITYLNKYNIQSDATSLGITFDKTTQKWDESNMSYQGYYSNNLAKNLKGVIKYFDENGSVAMQTGYYINKGQAYAVLQVLTFNSYFVAKEGTEELLFLDALRNFILEVKENKLPLILDLRVNGGGYMAFPPELLRMLTKEKDVYAPATTGIRMTQYSRGLKEISFIQTVVAENESEGMTNDMLKNLIDTAIDNGANYIPMYAYGAPIEADPIVNGFDNKIVALVTADCLSACDMAAFLIKNSKRATIIGTQSNGTGAGHSTIPYINTNWSDRLNVLSSNIPNFLFGRPGNNIDTLIYGENSVSELCTENKPTVADIAYKSSMLDLTNDNLGWLQKAAEVLNSKKE